MWYTKGSNAFGTPSFKIISREDGDWTALTNEMKDWLNKYVSPHMLISVSIYQDAHEDDENQ